MRASRARAVLAAAIWALGAAALPCSAQVVAGGMGVADETKVIQGAYLSLAATEAMIRQESPFLNPYWNSGDWRLSAYTYDSFSLSFRARGVSGQVSAWVDADAAQALEGAVSQAWIKATFGEGWALAFGRRELRWKDGGYWNPSDVVNYRLSWDEEGEVSGRDSIELLGLLPFMDFNLDINLATAFDAASDDLGKLPLYLNVGTILYPLEFHAKAALQSDRLPIFGGSARLSLTGVDLYADLAWLRDEPRSGELESASGLDFAEDEGSWLRFCVGGTWALDISRTRIAKSMSLRLEYLRQDDGLSADQGAAFFEHLDSVKSSYEAWGAAYNAWDERYFSLYRDYALLSVGLGDIANAHLGLDASCLANLDDGSIALRGSLSWSPKNLMRIGLSTTGYLGPEGSEARALPRALSCSLTLSKSF